MITWLLILVRITGAVFSNVSQKKLALAGFHPFYIVMAFYALTSLIALPFLPWISVSTLPTTFWLNISAAAVLDMAAFLFLVLSVSRTDLSVFGPLNAYKVVFSAVLAFFILGEVPQLQGMIGMSIIIAASYLLFPPSASQSGARIALLFRDRGVQYRFLSILLFSIGTLPLKNAVMASTPLTTTVFWALVGLPAAVLANRLFVHENLAAEWQRSQQYCGELIWLAALIFIVQYCTLVLFSQFQIGYALALFQFAMVLQVFLGHKLFNEPHLYRRLAASGIMVVGSLLVLYSV